MALQTLTQLENGMNSLNAINSNFTLLGQGTVSTTDIYIDGNRTDTYTPNGSISYPYKTISTAIAGINALNYTAYVIRISPATYTETNAVVFPSFPYVIYGNGSTFVALGGVTFANQFDCYDLTIIGNIIQSDTSLATVHNFSSGFISGNLTVNGLCNLNGMATTTSISMSVGNLITINAGAQLVISDSSIGASISNSGILYFNGSDLIRNDNGNYLITSTVSTSIVYISGSKFINYGTGGGINCSGVQTGYSNEINAVDVIVNGSTNAITCGNATTSLSNYNGINSNNLSVPVIATGSAFIAATNTYFQIQSFPTVSAPTAAPGVIYYDSTLNKLRIGVASGYQTITSA